MLIVVIRLVLMCDYWCFEDRLSDSMVERRAAFIVYDVVLAGSCSVVILLRVLLSHVRALVVPPYVLVTSHMFCSLLFIHRHPGVVKINCTPTVCCLTRLQPFFFRHRPLLGHLGCEHLANYFPPQRYVVRAAVRSGNVVVFLVCTVCHVCLILLVDQ